METIPTRARVAILLVVCAVAAGASLAAVSRGSHERPHGPGTVGAPASSLGHDPELLFRSTSLDRDFGTVAVVPRSDPSEPRHLAPLRCDRVDFAGGRGLCLNDERSGLATSAVATVFDGRFRVLSRIDLAGLPSRARVSPDGRYGATTTFVAGDSYASAGFSTRTTLIDLRTGRTLFDLEKLAVTKDGNRFRNANFNFWGVTFVAGTHRFYATLGSYGATYLVEGDLATRKAHVVRGGVECPSLSPDGTRIAFKQRNPGTVVTWHIAVLDLHTLRVHRLAETRDVDDQVAWLDDDTVMYGLAESQSKLDALGNANGGTPVLGSSASIATDTWTIPADGSGRPHRLLQGAWSTVPVSRSSRS